MILNKFSKQADWTHNEDFMLFLNDLTRDLMAQSGQKMWWHSFRVSELVQTPVWWSWLSHPPLLPHISHLSPIWFWWTIVEHEPVVLYVQPLTNLSPRPSVLWIKGPFHLSSLDEWFSCLAAAQSPASPSGTWTEPDWSGLVLCDWQEACWLGETVSSDRCTD